MEAIWTVTTGTGLWSYDDLVLVVGGVPSNSEGVGSWLM